MAKSREQSLQDQIDDLKAEIIELSALVAERARGAPTSSNHLHDVISDLVEHTGILGKGLLSRINDDPGKARSIASVTGLGIVGLWLMSGLFGRDRR